MKIGTHGLLFMAALSLSSTGLRAQVRVLMIANPGVKAEAVTKKEIRSVFTGASVSLSDGERVKPVLLKEGPAQAAFASDEAEMSQVGLIVCWRNLVFSGQATMPQTFGDEPSVVSYVARTPGALGYISTATPHEGVKVLPVK